MNKIRKIFHKEKNIIIGVIHFPPLLGYKNFFGFKVALKDALSDLHAFEKGGVDGIIIENNYDIPHTIQVGPEIVAAITYLGQCIRSQTALPLGVSVLWNDYRAALSIAKTLNFQFVRIPVFVDTVQTSYGIVKATSKEVIRFRKKVNAENVALFTDIHVKHSTLISNYTLEQSARLAIRNNSDAVIVTGKWTGDTPEFQNIQRVRKAIRNQSIFVGSGVDEYNIHGLFQVVNGAIVSTSLKKGNKKKGETNIKSYTQRIDTKKVQKLISKVKR